MATDWKSAVHVHQLPTNLPKARWVQDFEPWLYEMGSACLQAENSLRLGLPLIVQGRWLTHKLITQFQASCRTVDFGADLKTYRPVGASKEFALSFFFQPELPQSAPSIGLEALHALLAVLPTLKIYLFGSKRAPKNLAPGFIPAGQLPPDQLNSLFNRCLAGVCLSASNPHRAIFEMMAAGLPVVSLHLENTLHDLPDSATLLAEADPVALKSALLRLLANTERRQNMALAATAFMASRSLEAETGQFVEAIENLLAAPATVTSSRETLPPRYQTPPVPAVAQPGPDLLQTRWSLVSFDIWDTVLRRRCHPDEIKLHTARYFALKFASLVKHHLRDSSQLMQLRVGCEHAIGERERTAGLDNEYNILEVFRLWVSQSVNRILDEDELQRITADLLAAELEQERMQVYPDPQFAALLSRLQADRYFFASDFYMPADMIRGLLDHAGVRLPSRDGVASCDAKLNKRSGRLFRQIEAAANATPARHLHIGDNEFSDVFIPERARLSAIHYWNELEERRRASLNRRYRNRARTARPYAQELAAQLRGIGAPPDRSPGDQELFLLGVKSSLLFVGFILQVAEQALMQEMPAVYFFTREGEFFQHLYQALAQHNALGVPLPPSHLLEVSRLATFAASVQTVTPAELMRIWTLYSTQSMEGLLRSFDLDPGQFGSLLSRHQLRLSEEIRYPWQDERVQNLLRDSEFQTHLGAHCQRKRALFTAYLAQKGLTLSTRRAAIVDIGWRGTIQDNLARVLPQTEITGFYLGLHRFLNPQPDNTRKHAFGPNANLPTPEPIHLLEFVSPVEMLCNSPSGSVLRYVAQGGAVTTERERNTSEDSVFEQFTRHFQDGVLAAVPAIAEFVRRHVLSSTELRPFCLELLGQLTESPPLPLARAYFGLNHNETFGLGRYENKNKHLANQAKAREVYFSGDRAEMNRVLQETTWPQGFARLCGLGYHFNLNCPPDRSSADADSFQRARSLLSRAAAAAQCHDWRGAAHEALEALACWPSLLRAHALLMHVYLQSGRRALAFQHFAVVQARCTEHPPSLNELAVNGFREGYRTQPAELWTDLLKSQPAYRAAIVNLSRIHLRSGAGESAKALLSGYLEKRPGDPEATALAIVASLECLRNQQSQVASALGDLGRLLPLKDLEQRIIEAVGQPSSIPLELSSQLLKNCRLDLEPISDLDYFHQGADPESKPKLLRLPGSARPLRLRHGPITSTDRTIPRPVPVQPEALTPTPERASDDLLSLAVDHLNAGQPSEALHLFDQVLLDRPAAQRPHYGRALALARLGRRDEALQTLARLSSGDGGNGKAHHLLEELRAAS